MIIRIRAIDWGDSGDPFSEFHVWVGKDPRRVIFRGDAYYQWDESPLRNNDKNACWTQALHDAMEGWHSCILHTGDDTVILPKHPDFDRIVQLISDVDAGRAVPS